MSEEQINELTTLVVAVDFEALSDPQKRSCVFEDDTGALYPIEVDPLFSFTTKLVASDSGAFEFFGHSVAISGDTVLVGAPDAEIGASLVKVNVIVASSESYIQNCPSKRAVLASESIMRMKISVGGDEFWMVIGMPHDEGDARYVRAGQDRCDERSIEMSAQQRRCKAHTRRPFRSTTLRRSGDLESRLSLFQGAVGGSLIPLREADPP